MKRSKKIILIVLGVILLAAVVGILAIGLQLAPTVDHALRISELLQPMLETKNQAMHITASAEINDTAVSLESDIFRTTEAGVSYLAVEQNGAAVYIVDNLLFLENGKAFKLGGAMQPQVQSIDALLPQISALYEVLRITAEKMESETVYSITVTGEDVKNLLEAASLGEALPVEEIDVLNLQLAEKNGKLDQISFSGSGNADGTPVQLHTTLSGFRVLAAGDYPIPDAVKQTAATVNPEELFNLTEDLYRLVLALAPFADMDNIDGTLDLAVDCGLLQLDTQMDLSDLKTASDGQLDPEALQKLPEILGFLCLEGDISCKPDGDRYEYILKLDQQAMQELARMILPELAQYSGNLAEGSVSIQLTGGTVVAMAVSLKGEIPMLLARVPVSVSAAFSFH